MTTEAPPLAPVDADTTGSSPPPRRPRGPRSTGMAASQTRWAWLFVAPAVVGFAVFTLGPMLASLVISLTDWTIGGSPSFVGFGNYQQLAGDPLFWSSLRATAYYAVLAVPGGLLFAFAIAVLLHRARYGRGFFRTPYYLPVLVPPVASAVLWLWIFNPDAGLLNTLLRAVGLPPSLWVFSAETVVPSLALMAVWGFGNMTLVFLAGLQGVPRELYEAAECDGAGPLRRMWSVTIPTITPIIFFNLITGMIAAFQVFDVAFVMTNGGPDNASLFYVLYLYRKAFADAQLGYASALAWVLFLVVLVVTGVMFRSARRWVFSSQGNGR